MITKQDLDLIPITDLRDALVARFDAIVFIGQQTEKIDHIDYHYAGGKTTCLGLLEILKDQIKEDFKKETERNIE